MPSRVSVSLLVPGLAAAFGGIADESFPQAESLSRFLSRSTATPFPARDRETAACALFGLSLPDPSVVPFAFFSYLGDFGKVPPLACLRADPVHLRADTRGLVLFDSSRFSFSPQESTSLAASLAELLHADGWQLEASQARRWYLLGNTGDDPVAMPLSRVLGRTVSGLPVAQQPSLEWQTRLNEIQMLMHASPVNLGRSRLGQPALNSLWIWGGGTVPEPFRSPFSKIFSADALVRGLARWGESPCREVPKSAPAMLDDLQGGDRILVDLDGCRGDAACEDFRQWTLALENLERDWFAPLYRALASGVISELELVPANGYRYTLTRRQRWQFWRRQRPYREILFSG